MNTKKILILLMILFLIISFCTGYLMGHSRGIIFQKQQTEKDPCLLRISEVKKIESETKELPIINYSPEQRKP